MNSKILIIGACGQIGSELAYSIGCEVIMVMKTLCQFSLEVITKVMRFQLDKKYNAG
ncbi:hypothetical protein [Flavivirga spongiicola]|uniref:NAD-dependent epimerase/dehydratase family protein n=1 Tax=Flavivirga spongiicola TaxID=421621 RepID=A0ABU7XSI9_9FLAO|nr:hypothetical protein [Flavivirga sp. MEBiC05379]MDO5978555.1 hypothetical protein [Flavivirga sp. MEBiC05379]